MTSQLKAPKDKKNYQVSYMQTWSCRIKSNIESGRLLERFNEGCFIR
jgi:hypothetical protein